MDFLFQNVSLNEVLELISYKAFKSILYSSVTHDFRSYIQSNTSMCNFNDHISYDTIPFIMAPISIFIIIITLVGQLRWKIIFPYDVLNYYGQKQLVCVIFVAYANMLLASWVESDFERSLQILTNLPYLRRALFKIVLMLVYGTAAYPLLAALSHPIFILRFFTTFYSGAFFGLHCFHYYRVVSCKSRCTNCGYNIRDYFVPLPSMISFAILSFSYLILLLETLSPRLTWRSKTVVITPEDYVRELFKNKDFEINANDPLIKKLKRRWKRWNSKSNSIRYPPLLLASMACSATITYELVVVCLHHLVNQRSLLMRNLIQAPSDDDFRNVISYFHKFASTINSDNVLPFVRDEDFKENLENLFHYIGYRQIVCGIVALTIASLYALVTVLLLTLTFRQNLIESFQEYSSAANKIARESTADGVILGFVLFTGFQTAFLCAGFLLHYWLFTLVFMGVEFGAIIPLKFGYGDHIIDFLMNIWPTMILTIIIAVLQSILANYLFTDRGKTLAVRYKKVLFLFGHYLFFYNFILGIFALIYRILQSLVFFLLLIPRMDHTVLPMFFKKLDRPYYYYMQYLYMINLHSNPVLLGFIQCLKPQMNSNIISESNIELNLLENDNHNPNNRNRAAIMHWKMAYTLLWNPQLKYYRKHAIDEHAEKLKKFSEAQRREDELKSHTKTAFLRLESIISRTAI